ncbi:large conductance mechanosensitive channel protein MscL [Sphingomicrobium lutaoense]|uniref:Large-conductance mechanosensitive channel n=1 Tax=Sphingomicrobium lutaoense TaxID=515949 RepID=A0A839Z262_9SPHN|nr:large conductance mechanosensitive channel protein MscL [Sphingomicrobium lutaoense]MBB3764127.1 large conductance mechanosensitive channel [Sphingomicrobium lutaoense]
MLKEFKAFIAKGNVIDLAVAVIIGGAFALITASLTDDIIMPVVGALFGGVDFSNYFTLLGPIPEGFEGNPNSYADLKEAGAAVMGWGQFITVVINFLILAFIIFIMVRQVNRFTAKEEEKKPAGPSEKDLLADILAELKKRP